MSEIFQRYGLRRVINVSGTETAHGASPVADEVITAVTEILPHSVEMIELQRAASSVIARVTGAEAGCVVNCAAAGITVGVAACMAGDDLARIEQLPDTTGMKDRVVMQKGHVADFSASTAQMVRISGARVVEVGTATDCAIYQLRAALDGEVAAALYVVSHHTVQGGLLPLERFLRGLPRHGRSGHRRRRRRIRLGWLSRCRGGPSDLLCSQGARRPDGGRSRRAQGLGARLPWPTVRSRASHEGWQGRSGRRHSRP